MKSVQPEGAPWPRNAIRLQRSSVKTLFEFYQVPSVFLANVFRQGVAVGSRIMKGPLGPEETRPSDSHSIDGEQSTRAGVRSNGDGSEDGSGGQINIGSGSDGESGRFLHCERPGSI